MAAIAKLGATHLTICGYATDYYVDTTVKIAASKGYALTIVSDAHTTADRQYVTARQLIAQHNEVWSELAIPGSFFESCPVADIYCNTLPMIGQMRNHDAVSTMVDFIFNKNN